MTRSCKLASMKWASEDNTRPLAPGRVRRFNAGKTTACRFTGKGPAKTM